MKGTDAADGPHDLDLAIQVMLPVAVPGVTGALRAMAAWAQAGRGARTLGDVLANTGSLPEIVPQEILKAHSVDVPTAAAALGE